LEAGKIRLLLQQFIQENTGSGEKILVTGMGTYPEVRVRPPRGTGESSAFFACDAGVKGELTRNAFEHAIVPEVKAFEELVAKISADKTIDDVTRVNLERTVQTASQAYADDYSQAWERLYASWHIDANVHRDNQPEVSLESLQIVFDQLRLPTSPFQ